MFWKLFALFTIVPAIELYLLFQIEQVLGIVETVLIILMTGSLGAALASGRGWASSPGCRATPARASPLPTASWRPLVLVGGVLLITPGVFTDLGDFLLILPPTLFLAPRVKDAVVKRFTSAASASARRAPAPGGQRLRRAGT